MPMPQARDFNRQQSMPDRHSEPLEISAFDDQNDGDVDEGLARHQTMV